MSNIDKGEIGKEEKIKLEKLEKLMKLGTAIDECIRISSEKLKTDISREDKKSHAKLCAYLAGYVAEICEDVANITKDIAAISERKNFYLGKNEGYLSKRDKYMRIAHSVWPYKMKNPMRHKIPPMVPCGFASKNLELERFFDELLAIDDLGLSSEERDKKVEEKLKLLGATVLKDKADTKRTMGRREQPPKKRRTEKSPARVTYDQDYKDKKSNKNR